MCGRNGQPSQRCQQPNPSSRISASGVQDADFVESFLLRWHRRSCFRIDGQKIYREPKGKIVRKTFKYCLYPTRQQTEALLVQRSEACRLYNAALQERIEAYRTHHKSINYYDPAAQLTEIRKAGDFGLPNGHCAQDRSEERRVGKECRSRWSPDYSKEKTIDGREGGRVCKL